MDPAYHRRMEDLESIQYFERRAEEEQLAAVNATDERAAQTHRALAARYYARTAGGPVRDAQREEPISPGILPKDFRILP